MAVLATADQWTHATRESDGREFWIIPASKNNGVYYTDARACTCPDSGRGLTVCKHSRAVQLFTLRSGASPVVDTTPSPARATCRVCTQELPAGLISGLCDPCIDAGLMFEGIEALKAAFGSDAGAIVQTTR